MKNEEKTYDLFKFEDGDFSLDVMVSFSENTVWLSAQEIANLFERSYKTIQKHINNIFFENELEKASNSQKLRLTGNTKPTQFYNLNVIIAVGYRVNSKRGTLLKIWADSILNNNTTIDDYNIRNMPRISEKYQLVKFEDGDFSLDVKVSPNEETVLLNREEIAYLFDRDIKTISKHINNALNEECNNSTVAKFATVQIEGDKKVTREIEYFDLDIITSVGYRVKSKRGILFRKWANSILKQYLLNGYSIDKDRIIAYQSNILQLEANVINIENRLKNLEMTIYSDNKQIIFEGEILEPYTFLRKLFFLAKNEITIIDQYADKFLLSMLSDLKVKITIITSSSSYLNKEMIPDNITVIHNDIIHDRFIIIDENVYAMGSSFNSIGKKRFFIIRLEDITKEMILK